MDWSNQLGLSFSPTGRIVHSLSASVEQARSCLMQAPRIYDAFGTFGEAMGPETPEEDSLQTPSGLLIELAELKLCVKLSEQIFRWFLPHKYCVCKTGVWRRESPPWLFDFFLVVLWIDKLLIPQIAIAIGVLTSNRGGGRRTTLADCTLQGAVDVVPLLGAIVVCYGCGGGWQPEKVRKRTPKASKVTSIW